MIDRPMAFAAAGFVIAGQHGDAFEQGGFAGAVFAGDDGDWPVETHLELVAQERQAERIGRRIGDEGSIEPDLPEVRRGHVDGSITS